MPTNNNNNTCRVVAQNIASLILVAGADVHRLTYTGIEGVALHIRERFIGGDPHNYTVYEKLGLSPRDAFAHAQRVFGYAPTNLKTATVKRGIDNGAWAGCQTPHWAEGDFAAAKRLIDSLAAMAQGGVAAAIDPVEARANELLAAAGINNPSAALQAEVRAVVRSWRGRGLLNNSNYIAGISHMRKTVAALGEYLYNAHGNTAVFNAIGVDGPAERFAFVNTFSAGTARDCRDGCPYSNHIAYVIEAMKMAARIYPLGGILLFTGLSQADRAALTAKIAASTTDLFDHTTPSATRNGHLDEQIASLRRNA